MAAIFSGQKKTIMKLLDIVLLSLSVAFFIIAVDQIMTLSPASGYWAVMLTLIFFFLYILRKKSRK